MRPRTLAFSFLALGLLLGTGGRARSEGVLPTVAQIARRAPEILKLIDELTQKERAPRVKTLLKGALGEEKLVVWTSKIDVQATRWEGNWRGWVSVTMNVPARVSYHVDLSKFEAKHLKYDAGKRILRVKMPPVELGEVSAVLRDLEMTPSYSGMRFSFYDNRVVDRLKRGLLREDFDSEAKSLAAGQSTAARNAARTVLQRFLQRTFSAARTEVTVVVE